MTVWNEMKDKQRLTPEKIAEECADGCYNRAHITEPEMDDFKDDDGHYDWDKLREARIEYGKKLSKRFLADNSEAAIYTFTYSDNDGEYQSALEHGELFRRLPHIAASHHQRRML